MSIKDPKRVNCHGGLYNCCFCPYLYNKVDKALSLNQCHIVHVHNDLHFKSSISLLRENY